MKLILLSIKFDVKVNQLTINSLLNQCTIIKDDLPQQQKPPPTYIVKSVWQGSLWFYHLQLH